MGMPNYKNGLRVMGTPVMTGNAFAGWFGTEAYFVDGDSGSDSYDGKKPTRAFATIQHAIDKAGTQDTIYVRVKAPDADASEPGTYEEDLSIPYAKHGLRIIGASPQIGVWGGPKIKNATATTLLEVLASNVHLENLSFNCTRNSGTYGILLDGNTGYTTKAGSVGANIINCFLKNSSATYRGISLNGGYGSCIYGLHTYNAESAVWMGSTLPSNDHRVIDCDFTDNNGAAVACHIIIMSGLNVGFVIKNSTFGRATKFITVGGSCSGIISKCHFEDLVATLANAAGKVSITVGTHVAVTGCFGGVGLAVIQDQS